SGGGAAPRRAVMGGRRTRGRPGAARVGRRGVPDRDRVRAPAGGDRRRGIARAHRFAPRPAHRRRAGVPAAPDPRRRAGHGAGPPAMRPANGIAALQGVNAALATFLAPALALLTAGLHLITERGRAAVARLLMLAPLAWLLTAAPQRAEWPALTIALVVA